jgi:hypothetical protein
MSTHPADRHFDAFEERRIPGVHINDNAIFRAGYEAAAADVGKDVPTLKDVALYCRERGNSVDPQRWYDHYLSNGWKVGRNKMKDWKAAVRTWERMGVPQFRMQ